MTFPRMNDKPCDVIIAFDDQAKPRLRNEQLSERIASSTPSVDELRSLAEQEFADSYGLSPTCAVFAPGCLTVAGKSVADLAETRSLSMAVQLVTLVVGKRSHGGKRCQVKRLLLHNGERESREFRLNDANLCIAAEEASWIRCLKATIRSFKERRAVEVPGFKVVIVSSVPARLGLGSNTALIVALYMFLEAIANTWTGNLMERMLVCQLAERLATTSDRCKVRASDILTCVIANEGQMVAFDARSLDVERPRWNDTDVQLVLVELSDDDLEEDGRRSSSARRTRCEQVATVMNTMSRWRAHPIGASPMMALLFPRETMEMANDAILRDDETITRMTSAIRRERWEEFGRIRTLSNG